MLREEKLIKVNAPRARWFAVLAAAVAFAAPAAAQANEVTDWNRIATNTLVAFPGAAGGAPPALNINMGMTQGAVYDALNATEPRHHRPYLLKRRFSARASKEAAAATAAYRVLSSIVSTVPVTISFPNRASLLQTLEAQYDTSLAALPETPFKRQGIAAGNAAAEAMIAARQDDGRFGPSQWVPNPAPGHWWPLLNPDGTPMLDPTAWVGGVRPFLMQSASQFRTAGPQSLTSAAWAADFNEVKALGSVNSTARTPEQTHIALWWQSAGGPALLWNPVARNLVENPTSAVDIVDSARLFAMLNLTAADASINCWNDKYHFDFWRPWNAIPRAAEDGNPATQPDPSWRALLTAPYPSHPSGHLCNDAAYLTALGIFFGTDEIGFDVTSSRFPSEPARHFDRFSEPLDEIIEARIWAGLHYRTADVQAVILGRNVAEYMARHYFQPVGKH
ncbi:MAG: vanadium-dependent haloperoxidase [Gaiellaceae bacterium]